jgi:phosphoglycerol transferase MdoB-like AlkP superfamily enzyme
MMFPAPQSIGKFIAPQSAPALVASAYSYLLALLQSPTAMLLAAGLVLPNLLSLATLGSFIDIGLPPRTGCILLYAALAMCARRIPYVLTATIYLGIVAFDLVWTLSVSFGMRPHDLVSAIEQARRIHVLTSTLYIALLCVMVTTTLCALYLLSRRSKLLQGNILALFAAALAFSGLDYVSNADAHYNFGAMLGSDVPVVSAVNASGFDTVAGVNGRNVVFVMVESLGNLIDADARARIVAPIYDPRVTAKYDVSYGRIDYYGSTTSGEMRELCGTREPFAEFTAKAGYSCMPERLRMRGYGTLAVHGFFSTMFGRDEWYPRIGFDNMVFGEALAPRIHRLCGAVFRGACDADLPPLILKETAALKKPRFIYWLTLNTHIPAAPREALTDFGCEQPSHGFGIGKVCRMAELWHDVFAAVSKLALDPAIGPAEILIVGDHAPPLWSRRGRGEFEAGKVPWYRLTPRADVVAANAH